MMDWKNIQIEYYNLKQEWDDAWDRWISDPTDDEKYNELGIAKSRFSIFCMDVMEQLMEKNADVLERLKKM